MAVNEYSPDQIAAMLAATQEASLLVASLPAASRRIEIEYQLREAKQRVADLERQLEAMQRGDVYCSPLAALQTSEDDAENDDDIIKLDEEESKRFRDKLDRLDKRNVAFLAASHEEKLAQYREAVAAAQPSEFKPRGDNAYLPRCNCDSTECCLLCR